MSSKSDNNNKPRSNIFELLPEVYRSDLNDSIFENSFNRHLTKDDFTRVSGFVGPRNPTALTDRQIKEPTPHRQAYQLQPAMYTKVGTVDHVLTQTQFLNELELMGVDKSRLQSWGSTRVFNWAPPINIDMLVNYFDYYWPVSSSTDIPQYFTIENRCNKARSKSAAYENLINKNGTEHAIVAINPKTNTITIDVDLSFMFVAGFVFYTTNTTDPNIKDTFWTTESSSYDTSTGLLTITTEQNLAIVSDTAPVTTIVGRWWYDADADILSVWSGSAWNPISSAAVIADISLSQLLSVYQRDANCACDEDFGWDMAPWDDNQDPGAVLWNTALMAAISHDTEADWIIENGAPTLLDLWYDTTADSLKQYNGTVWVSVVNSFSTILVFTEGRSRWDETLECIAQEMNQWSSQNKWQHKSQVSSFGGVKRAQIPILEYNSTIELGEWSQTTFSWKYRNDPNVAFESVDQPPHRIELEPIKNYGAVFDGAWYLYMFTTTDSQNRDIDYTSFFTPGTRFSIVDDASFTETYTVARSEYRKIQNTDDINVLLNPNVLTDYYVTVVELADPVFVAPTTGGGTLNTRIVPRTTSQGDVWRGYHVHWLLDGSSTTAATTQPLNPLLAESLAEQITPQVVPDGLLEVGLAHQTLTVTVAGVNTIELDASFLYDSAESRFFALAESNELRVYVNGIRQYGSYQEQTTTGVPSYTMVGDNATTLATFQYVTGIVFDSPLAQFDIVRIEICPSSMRDMGLFAIPVRTVESESDFIIGVASGTQPTYVSLTQYHHQEQVKVQTNQYPHFNVYDIVQGTVIDSSPLFAYKEDADQPVNPNVSRRIVATTDGRDYTFIQYLLNRDDDVLYGYRNLDNAPETGTYWYSPQLNVVQYWDGRAWNERMFISTVNGLAQRTPVISSTEPSSLLTVDGALWFNPTTEVLRQRSTVGSNWTILTDVIVADADPTIQTVWKNSNDNQYVPSYVDSNKQPITVGDPDGDWEILSQWFYNSEHKNKAESNYTQLVTHFRSMVTEQNAVPGLPNGGTFTLTQNDYDYGIGGIIKEHNDSFDTLISAVNVNNVTPVGLMEWVEDQYALGTLLIRDIYNRNLVSQMSSYTSETIADQNSVLIDNAITQFKLNDRLSLIYGDTTAYNRDTDVGMPNWIATAPILGLMPSYRPHLISGDGFIELYHHDGHRAQISYTAGEIDRFARQLIAVADPRVTNGTLGVQSNAVPPTTESAFISAFGAHVVLGGNEVRTGVYWYRVVGGIQTLYRFVPLAVTAVAPSFMIDGVEIADGARYYNTLTNLTYIKSGLSWVVDTGTPFDVSTLWETVDFNMYVAELLLEVENRLYAMSPEGDLKFDYSTVESETSTYAAKREDRFNAFTVERGIVAPLVNNSYTPINAFSWNYTNSVINTPPRNDITPDLAGSWQELYTRWYGTPYPHLEPWKLQGFYDKPIWWDEEYLETSGSRRWIYDHDTTTGMWENIRIGHVPAGYTYPDGSISTGNSMTDGQSLPTYNYFSVNISNITISGDYQADALLPPYYDTTSAPAGVSSIFTSFVTQISAPDADYTFGDGGPVEWQWTVSTEYVYDQPIIAFLIQPVRFLHASFGLDFIEVDGLQVETLFNQVYSHEDVLFHGDIYNTDLTFVANGLNQWYVNFNRFSGFDTNNEFRDLWAGWNPRQSYSFAGIVDTGTFSISTRYFDIIDEDYQIILSNTGTVDEMWTEGFEVSVLSIPPSIRQYNNQGAWRFSLSSLAAVSRELTAYGTKQYPFTVNITSDECTFFNYNIIDASAPNQRFYVAGDHTAVFTRDTEISIAGSTNNDGVYTVLQSVFEPSANRTRINVNELVPSSQADGQIDVTGFSSPWETGQEVVLTSSRGLPAPVVTGEPYYIIRTGTRTFKLAETINDALSNISIDFLTVGEGDLQIGELETSFRVYGGASHSKEVWYHFALDRNKVYSFTPPSTVVGMQNLINIIDGYVEYQKDAGIVYNLGDKVEFDAATGRSITWQFETERFIDWAYALRRTRMSVADRFDFTASTTLPSQELTFGSAQPSWTNGTPIMFTSTGSLPSPLIANTPYYFVNTGTPGMFKVSITSNTSFAGNHVTITTAGSGILYVSQHRTNVAFPAFEINPTRNNIWIDTPEGVLSNVIAGPYTDLRVNQALFDQYGRLLTADKINVFRQDQLSRIAIRPELEDDLNYMPIELRTQYDYLHLGGGHFFVEGYEHVILFNDYSVGGALIYDQFYGLYTTKFELDYYEESNYTLRPNLGGHYLAGNEFLRNIEGSTVDARNLYDVYDIREGTVPARYARGLISYDGRKNYLDLLNANDKTQFLFYRGMLQHKGSVAGAKAYINSRRFIDAKVDEFWAWKVGEFGDARSRIYPQIKLLSTDAITQDVRLHFLSPTEFITDSDVVAAVDEAGFKPVEWTEPARWEIYPEQRSEIENSLFIDAEVSSMWEIYVAPTAASPIAGETTVQYWFDTTLETLNEWDGSSWNEVVDSDISFVVDGATTYIKLDQIFDDVRVVRRDLASPRDLRQFNLSTLEEGDDSDYMRLNSEVLKFSSSAILGVLVVFTINPAFSKVNPSKLIDKKSKTVVSDVQLWDPARGHHSTIAIHNVDLQHAGDPAVYTTTLNETTQQNAWVGNHVEQLWLDTTTLGYNAYYDEIRYPDINVRLNKWGVLADWASVNVYEWTASSVPPSDWATAGERQAGDILRPQRSKATGVARQTLFKRTRETHEAAIEGITSGTQLIDFSPAITGASSTGLALGTFGYQNVLFVSTPVLGNATGLTGTAPFQANVFVDGNPYLLSVSAASATTYSVLLSQIDAQLLGAATASIVGNNIRITSATRGIGSSVIIQDINLFGSLNVATATVQTGVPGTSTTYTSTFTFDGTSVVVNVLGDDAQTIDDLVDVVNAQLAGGTLTISSGDLVATSASVGTSSTVSIVDGTLFSTINGTRPHTINAATVGTFGKVVLPTGIFEEDDLVLFTTGDTLPSPLEVATKYLVANITTSLGEDTLTIVDVETEEEIEIATVGVGTLTAVPAFKADAWTKSPFIRERQYGALHFATPSEVDPTIILEGAEWTEYDGVSVYVNDILVVSDYTLDDQLSIPLTNITITESDIIDIVRPLRSLTDAEDSFDPDVEDDGTELVQWKYDYEYSTTTTYDNRTPVITYFFWVKDSQYRDVVDNKSLSAFEIADQLANIPTPYYTVHHPKNDVAQALPEHAQEYKVGPVFYRQAVLRNASNFITEDNRYIWKFTRDLSLRYTMEGRNSLKNKHEQWQMFRREQPASIPRELWDKLTEALIGYTFADETVRVPSLERELYDALNDTDTQYGLGEGQAFCNKDYGLASIIGYLEDPTKDFAPVDIDSFFATYSFDTPANIRTAMDVIYNSFSSEHTNNIWFETLHDAFATRAKYKELMKTSWIALHGIRVLEVGGLFDD